MVWAWGSCLQGFGGLLLRLGFDFPEWGGPPINKSYRILTKADGTYAP